MSKHSPIKDLNTFVEKMDQLKKQNPLDLSSDQDLSLAIMNLVSIEEHFIFTGVKTGKDHYYDLMIEVREMRKSLLEKLLRHPEGEVWCISKHLLAASMRLMEVGTKQQGLNNKEDAKDMFQKAYDLYSLFWGLNMGAIDVSEVKKIDANALNKHDTDSKSSLMDKLGQVVKKVIDCCIE